MLGVRGMCVRMRVRVCGKGRCMMGAVHTSTALPAIDGTRELLLLLPPTVPSYVPHLTDTYTHILLSPQNDSSPASSFNASTTMSPDTIAFVVAMAWMMLPAMPLAANALCRGML
jgi:hypothetical protein